MISISNRLLSLFLILAWALRAGAQLADPVKVSAELNTTALKPGSEAVAAVVIDVKKGFHAQSHTPKDEFLIPLTVKGDAMEGITAGDVQYPPGLDEKYPDLGEVNVYTGRVVIYLPVRVSADAKEGAVKVSGSVRYQACDDKACFAPKTVPWSIETRISATGGEPRAAELFKGYKAAGGATTRGSPATTKPAKAAAATTIGDRPNWGVPLALGAAFIAGILFNIVPCVLPVLPIKVMGFAEVAQHDRTKTVALASVFGMGIVAVFAVLALFILVLKKFTWGQQFSNPWFAWGVVALLGMMAAWMFGWLNFNLPQGVYGISPRHDTMIGNFEWGALTAVLSTPCTGPLFPPLMLWAQSQPVGLGVTAVMMVGVGMASPYIVLSLFPEVARRFPRVGPWAELVKHMMGFVLVGAAVFFAAGRFLHGAALYWSLVPVAVAAALYLMARTIQYEAGPRGLTIAGALSLLLVGVTTWTAITFISPVKWEAYSDELIERERPRNIVLVKFTANWCLNCQYIERTVYHDKQTAAALARHGVVAVKADLTAEDAPGWKRLKTLSETGGIPLTAIYVPGDERPIVIDSVYTKGTLIQTLEGIRRPAVAAVR
jgi:thiol:disulfide interchange protein DsbD